MADSGSGGGQGPIYSYEVLTAGRIVDETGLFREWDDYFAVSVRCVHDGQCAVHLFADRTDASTFLEAMMGVVPPEELHNLSQLVVSAELPLVTEKPIFAFEGFVGSIFSCLLAANVELTEQLASYGGPMSDAGPPDDEADDEDGDR